MDALINITYFIVAKEKVNNKCVSLYIIVIKQKHIFEKVVNYYNIKPYKSDWIHIKTELKKLIFCKAVKVTEVSVTSLNIYGALKVK